MRMCTTLNKKKAEIVISLGYGNWSHNDILKHIGDFAYEWMSWPSGNDGSSNIDGFPLWIEHDGNCLQNEIWANESIKSRGICLCIEGKCV